MRSCPLRVPGSVEFKIEQKEDKSPTARPEGNDVPYLVRPRLTVTNRKPGPDVGL